MLVCRPSGDRREAAHSPYHKPPDHLHDRPHLGNDEQKFLAAIEAIDSELDRAFEAIPGDRTNVWFMADNGSPNKVLGSGLQDGKGSLHESGIRVPLMLSGPSIAATDLELDGVDQSAVLAGALELDSEQQEAYDRLLAQLEADWPTELVEP